MTRDSLRELEGGLVFFTARLRDCSSRGDIRDYVISGVRCWRWDGDERLNLRRAPDAVLDHVWLRFNREQWPTVELLSAVEGVARVGWYARSDGSADLGLRSYRAANYDEVMGRVDALMRQRRPRAEVLSFLSDFLSSHGGEDRYGYSEWLSASDAIARITFLRDRLERSEGRESAIRSTSHRGRRPSSARSFSDLLKRPTA